MLTQCKPAAELKKLLWKMSINATSCINKLEDIQQGTQDKLNQCSYSLLSIWKEQEGALWQLNVVLQLSLKISHGRHFSWSPSHEVHHSY